MQALNIEVRVTKSTDSLPMVVVTGEPAQGPVLEAIAANGLERYDGYTETVCVFGTGRLYQPGDGPGTLVVYGMRGYVVTGRLARIVSVDGDGVTLDDGSIAYQEDGIRSLYTIDPLVLTGAAPE